MAVKSVVLYPRPEDKAEFDRRYAEEHEPLCASNLPRMTQLRKTKVLGSPQGKPPYYLIVELHYDSMDDLNADFGSAEGSAVAKNAYAISSGGPPTILVTEA
ncbi:MAG: EthD family reductase [Chloroflexi bacterium]|nr:EthD family reductase [Chloroflexota bacterium]